MNYIRTKRILLAVEMDNGEAQVWEIVNPHVDIEMVTHEFPHTQPRVTLRAEGYYAQMYYRPSGDYFEARAEIAPPQPKLNP